ncbi:MAG: Ig-like domain-containing protein, partial [Prevotella sp.]|nr:Ig-like domain-containing protein [Prevotella sp.]
EESNIKYVRVTNKASGSRDIQAVKVYTPVGASDLTIKVSNISLTVGQTDRIMKDGEYTTSSTGAITFKSSAPKIVTVDNEGNITGVSEGTAKITLTQAADDNYNSGTLTFNITVNDNRLESNLALNSDAEITVEKGATAQINATCSNALTYTSGAPSIATVDESGKITAVGYGTATITISDPGSTTNKPGTKTVTVNVPDNRTESNLKVKNDELTVDRNATVQINVTQHDGALTYRSVDEDIATVDADGVVTGLLAGEATIVVSDAGSETAKAGSVNVTVNVNDTRAESQLAITSGTNIEIEMANSRTATITTTGAAGALSYESSDESIASVSAEGVITGKKAGTIEITVSDAGNNSYKPGTATITVTVIPVPTLDPVTWIVNDKSTLKNGASFSANANNTFVSTDETGSELLYVAGSNCEIADGSLKMGGSTRYNDNVLLNRYFVLPPLTGSGTLSVTYGSAKQNDLTIRNGNNKSDATVATITKSASSVHLTDLNNTVLYISADGTKAYINSITWIPDAPDTRLTSELTMTSGSEVAVAVGESSTITYEKNAGTVTFESDNTDVATVSADGTITGVANGVATITVTDPGNSEYKSATKTVTVTVGTGIEDRESQTWDFTTLSYTDQTNLNADYEIVPKSDTDDTPSENATTTKNWYRVPLTVNDANTFRYGNGKQLAGKDVFTTLSANGQELEMTSGLQFARSGNTLGAKNIRIDAGYRLSLNGGNIQIKIPGLKAGDIVYVDYSSANATSTRSLTVTNGTGENLSTAERTIAKITVTADGDLTIKQDNGMYYYRIFVNPAEVPTIPTTPTGIDGISADDNFWSTGEKVFDISGRQVFAPQKGQIYIKNGKKFIKK